MNVTFQIQGGTPITIPSNPGENLLELARRAGIALDAPCAGNGTCGKCRVKLLEGQLESAPSRHISDEEYAEGWRLSCRCRVVEDCTVLVPDTAGAYRTRIKTADLSAPRETAIFQQVGQQLRRSGICLENDYLALELTMDPPSGEDTLPDSDRLTGAIRSALGVSAVQIGHSVMVKLAAVLREHGFRVCIKGRREANCFICMDICAPGDTRLAGCAIDIGTTTVSALLTDLKTGRLLARGSCGNGQIRYGADVINRIIQQSRPGGREKLRQAILREALDPLLDALCIDADIGRDSILRVAIGANTTMNHLLLGVDAQPIRMEPYIPSFFTWEGLSAGEAQLHANSGAPVILAPNVGSYVGGDITAGTLASGIWDQEAMSLLIDLGTNGEIVFGNRDFLITCACSAGPAFEGGDISCGMRATDGAVEHCTVDGQSMEPTVSVIGQPGQKIAGICGSGIIDLIAQLFRAGIINARGLFLREGERVQRDEHGMGRYILAFPRESETGREVAITEVDIDNFIRAKGAVFSAVDTLLRSVDLDLSAIDQVLVAGGIGSGISMENAVMIGMLPDIPREKFQYIGNSSLAGAWALAMSDSAEEACGAVAANMTYLELSSCPGYMDAFIAACFLPHTDRTLFPSTAKEE